MGREIRQVPAHWEHPKRDVPNYRLGIMEERYQPLYDRDVESAWGEWQKEYAEWLAGEHDRVIAEYGAAKYPKNEPYRSFCQWHGEPPNPAYYRPEWDESVATWFQVYETVSEGTPVTPPFATKEELVDYLVNHGDFWDQKRGEGCWPRHAAEQFVGMGWAPSLAVVSGPAGVKIEEPRTGFSGDK